MGPGYNNKKPTIIIAPAEERKPWYDNIFTSEKPLPPDAKNFSPKQEAALDKILAPKQASIKPMPSAPPPVVRTVQAPTQAPASAPIAPMQQPAATEEKPWYSSIFGETKPGEPSAVRNAVDTGIHFLGAFGNNISGNRTGNVALNQAFAQRRLEYADKDPNSKSSILTRGMARELGMPIKGDETAYDLKPQMPYVRDMLTARAMRASASGGGSAQPKPLGVETQKVVANSAMALTGVNDMKQALEKGENTFSLYGDNNFTEARRRFTEGLGRLQSGGVIGPEELKNYEAMAPTYTDSKEQQQNKLRRLEAEIRSRIEATGANPDQILGRRSEATKAADIRYVKDTKTGKTLKVNGLGEVIE